MRPIKSGNRTGIVSYQAPHLADQLAETVGLGKDADVFALGDQIVGIPGRQHGKAGILQKFAGDLHELGFVIHYQHLRLVDCQRFERGWLAAGCKRSGARMACLPSECEATESQV